MIKNETGTFYTAYEAAAIVTAWLEEKGADKKVPPQMMYNYIKPSKNGTVKIESVEINDVKMIELGTLNDWFVKYYNKNVLGKKVVADLEIPTCPTV